MTWTTQPKPLFTLKDKLGIGSLMCFAAYCLVTIVQIVEKSGAF